MTDNEDEIPLDEISVDCPICQKPATVDGGCEHLVMVNGTPIDETVFIDFEGDTADLEEACECVSVTVEDADSHGHGGSDLRFYFATKKDLISFCCDHAIPFDPGLIAVPCPICKKMASPFGGDKCEHFVASDGEHGQEIYIDWPEDNWDELIAVCQDECFTVREGASGGHDSYCVGFYFALPETIAMERAKLE